MFQMPLRNLCPPFACKLVFAGRFVGLVEGKNHVLALLHQLPASHVAMLLYPPFVGKLVFANMLVSPAMNLDLSLTCLQQVFIK